MHMVKVFTLGPRPMAVLKCSHVLFQCYVYLYVYCLYAYDISVFLCRTYNLRPGWIFFNVELF